MDKKLLRKKYKDLRANFTQEQIEDLSLKISNELLKLSIWDKNFYHIFLPIVSQKEINTEYILHILQGKDKNIIISKSDFATRKMQHFLLTDNTKILLNSYNIPEPVDGIEIPSSQIEVVFVPLLAYDVKGNRVGYGKGFYDQFLKDCKPNVIKIGLSLFEPEPMIEDIYKGDIKLDYCCTPFNIYAF